ncbi:MAG: hypothetical protein DRO36_06495 [Candidatus Hecatellales archaeon]|nr:MAG: hypothetical protein DRO36_06495 [Candidatus Hecatellales archaeon]
MSWLARLQKPAFVMCPPVYLSNKIRNNKWMEEDNSTINVGRALFQWNNLYELMTTDAIVYLLAPNPNLQDQTYINSFVVLAHEPDIAILSNFRAAGRAGEEREAASLLTRLGFKVFQAPPYFEGYPCLKWIHDNIYVAGYGERSTLKTQRYLAEAFDYKIIPVKTSPYLYHLDCLFFRLSDEYAIVAVDDIPKEAVKAISREIEVLPADHNDAMQGICNSIRLRRIVINASNEDELEGEERKIEVAKNEKLKRYAELAGMEVVFVNLSEFLKSGALASCLVAPLNYRHEE